MASETAENPHKPAAPLLPDRLALGIGLRLVAMVLITVMFAMVKQANAQGVEVAEILFWRQLVALPVVLLWLYGTGRLSDVRTHRPWGHAARMLLGLTAMALTFWAMTLLPLAEATSIGFAVPIFATLLAAALLKEQVGMYRLLAVVTGFIGILIIIQPFSAALNPMGAMVGIAGAVMAALVTVQLRHLSQYEASSTIVFWFSLSSLIPLGIAMPYVAGSHSASVWMLIGVIALTGALAQIMLTTALRFGPISVILPMDYSALLWSVLLGYFLFGDVPSSTTWLGAPIIIGAGLFIAWREHRKGVLIRQAEKEAAIS